MYSLRARIGVIAPLDDQVEYAFNKYAPEGVSFDSTRLSFPGPTPEGLIYLSDQLEDAAKMYRKKHHDVILFGCTSGSCIKGFGFDKECIERIERASGQQGLTTSTAVLEAFHALGLKKTVVMTPYPEDTNQAEKKFLEDNGLEVTSITGVGFNRVGEFSHPSKYFLYREAKKLRTEGAEVFFLSCMGLATMELVQVLEEDLGMPVITSHQASLWACLRHSRVNDKLPGLGRLFTI
ncbi:arylmalonate decarboxylase [Pseudoflavonifractor sp. MSJ-37]|nr:arylmalonate decarboxylase [Pseudoflavonifractor sp. MSJ-37]